METRPEDASPKVPGSYAEGGPRSLLRRAAGSVSTYTVGLFGARSVEFLLLPLYWALLPPAEYGILAVAAIISEFLKAVFGLGLPEAITRFYHDWPAAERPRRVGALWMAAWLSSFALAALLLVAGPWVLAPLIHQVPFQPYLSLAVLVALTASLLQVPLMVLRIMEKARLYVLVAGANTVVSTALALWFVMGLGRGAQGVLEAQAIGYALCAGVAGLALLRWARPSLQIRGMETELRFSLPLVPSKVLEATATVADRFFLEKLMPLASLGIYHAARQLGRAVEVFGFSLLSAWIPLQMRVLAERRDGRQVIASIAPLFLLAVLATSLALTLFAPDLIRLARLDDYRDVIPLIPLAVLSGAILSMAHVVIQGYIIARKTSYAWVRSGTRLAVIAVAMMVMVPRWGVHGAFLALSAAALAQGLVGYTLSQKFYAIPFRWGGVAWCTAGALLVLLAAGSIEELPLLVSNPLLGMAMDGVLLSAYVAAAGRSLWRATFPSPASSL